MSSTLHFLQQRTQTGRGSRHAAPFPKENLKQKLIFVGTTILNVLHFYRSVKIVIEIG
jgi:hypothetical protein